MEVSRSFQERNAASGEHVEAADKQRACAAAIGGFSNLVENLCDGGDAVTSRSERGDDARFDYRSPTVLP